LNDAIRLGRALSPEAAIDLAFGITPGVGEVARRWRNIFSKRTSNGVHQSAVDEPSLNSIAVLPFAHMSSAPDDEYFCDGLAEELINALAKIDELRVAARTSAFS